MKGKRIHSHANVSGIVCRQLSTHIAGMMMNDNMMQRCSNSSCMQGHVDRLTGEQAEVWFCSWTTGQLDNWTGLSGLPFRCHTTYLGKVGTMRGLKNGLMLPYPSRTVALVL